MRRRRTSLCSPLGLLVACAVCLQLPRSPHTVGTTSDYRSLLPLLSLLAPLSSSSSDPARPTVIMRPATGLGLVLLAASTLAAPADSATTPSDSTLDAPSSSSLYRYDNKVLLFRHGEKKSDSSIGLSLKGKKRAKCLRNVRPLVAPSPSLQAAVLSDASRDSSSAATASTTSVSSSPRLTTKRRASGAGRTRRSRASRTIGGSRSTSAARWTMSTASQKRSSSTRGVEERARSSSAG